MRDLSCRDRFAKEFLPAIEGSLEVLGKLLQSALDRPGRRVAEGAVGFSVDTVREREHEVEVRGLAASDRDSLEELLEPLGAVPARGAPSARLVAVEVGDPVRRLEDVSRLVEYDDTAGPEHRADRREALVVHRHALGLFGRDYRHGRAARDD